MDAYKICLKDMQDVNKSFIGYLTGWLDDDIYIYKPFSIIQLVAL